MYIEDGIAYAGEKKPLIKAVGVKPMEDYKLWIRFNTGETKIYDMKPLLTTVVFSPLSDQSVFSSVYLDYGIPVWNSGDIDIASEELYEHGVSE